MGKSKRPRAWHWGSVRRGGVWKSSQFQIPSPKSPTPKKLQISTFKIGVLNLELFWNLEVGVWSFDRNLTKIITCKFACPFSNTERCKQTEWWRKDNSKPRGGRKRFVKWKGS